MIISLLYIIMLNIPLRLGVVTVNARVRSHLTRLGVCVLVCLSGQMDNGT